MKNIKIGNRFIDDKIDGFVYENMPVDMLAVYFYYCQ